MENEKEDNYVVLARKYRPQNFDDLMGQDALVQTLTNAIKNNRLHHAYILTGIRGTGKTSTARIIAKALNCIGLDGKGGPTSSPCGVCENCVAIANDRHMDVIELDAASKTSVDDIREILDGVRYKPVMARYKIYIIDEVHMLSKSAFNALLKTLEEPPAHVKFIFATTEIRKVPVTIISRCQRFDLQRLTIEDLMKLFDKIVKNEGIKADEEALHIIAKAADGSARDGESLLDQAISLSNGNIKVETVKDMIGLSDRNQVFELFESLVGGEVERTVKLLDLQYKSGATPMLMLQDLINIVHMIAKTKIVPSFINDASLTENERELCKKLNTISIAVLSKIWQMMIKGVSELQLAPVQIDALEMILIRVAYSANMPTPSEILADVKKNSSVNCEKPAVPAVADEASERLAQSQNEGAVIATPEELVKVLEGNKKAIMAYSVKNDLSIEEFGDGFMKITISEKIQSDFILKLQNFFQVFTGKKWNIEILKGTMGETIADREKANSEEDKRNVSEIPLVKAILEEFKGSKIDIATKKVLEQELEKEESETEFLNEEF